MDADLLAMTERTEMERYIAWCQGEGLDGSKDYRALKSVARFRIYEQRMAEEARTALIERTSGKRQNSPK